MGACQQEFFFVGELLLDEAVRCYRTTVEWDEEHVHAWINLGLAYVEANKCPEAVDMFRHATTIDPDNAMAWNNLGYDSDHGWSAQ